MLHFYIKFYLLKIKIQINKLGFLKTNGPDNYIKKWERLEKY